MAADRLLPTVLVVEDDPSLARFLCGVLARWGYATEWAWSAEAALQAAERGFSVALLDLFLPDGNGVDLAGLLHALHHDMPLLLITACPFLFRERPEGARYFRQVLPKPLDLRQLREALSAALKEDDRATDQAACAR